MGESRITDSTRNDDCRAQLPPLVWEPTCDSNVESVCCRILEISPDGICYAHEHSRRVLPSPDLACKHMACPVGRFHRRANAYYRVCRSRGRGHIQDECMSPTRSSRIVPKELSDTWYHDTSTSLYRTHSPMPHRSHKFWSPRIIRSCPEI